MKIVLAPDKFKGTLTGFQFCDAVKAGILTVNPEASLVQLPLADGGDGTIDVVNYYLKGKHVQVEVSNPFFKPIKASYLYSEVQQMAFIEMAEASGVKLLRPEQLDCKKATTLGTGELIRDAIDRGAKQILLGIGGSATNDCGIGMATALGYRFLDKHNQEVKPIGANLSHIETIDATKVHPRLHTVSFKIACDVTNPLYGKQGAAYVYAKQKGASFNDIKMLDDGLQRFSKVLKTVFGIDSQRVEGAGAAGGMGMASKVFLKGELQSGIELIKELANFEAHITNADWIITGEGLLDVQTLSGKTIWGVTPAVKTKQCKVAALCGAIDLNEDALKNLGIDYADAVMNHAENLEDAMQNSQAYVYKMAKIFAEKIM
ncbi:glycerate kinase [Aestuariivivens insulae]|uniref:glycerate kinase n=1 Tax=Aestuariivivens insulae TaxID=1621988 RepID=UPI001F59DC26|nr:glycerate kinase [Aestuariivivens insulae]